MVVLSHDESSIDIPRAGSASLRSLEQSSGSTMLINQTPIDDAAAALSSRSLENLLDIEEQFDDIQNHPSPRISGIDILPDVVEADINEFGGPLLDPIPENERNDVEKTLINDDEEVNEVEQSFFTIGDDDDHLPKHLIKYQQRIMTNTGLAASAEDGVSFSQLYPTASTRRRDATLAFYTCLNLKKNNFIDMKQKEAFGDIKICRKTR